MSFPHIWTSWPKNLAALLFLLLVSRLSSLGQTINTEFLQSTVLVSYERSAGQATMGSGFFVFRPIGGGQGHVFLVTNRHVIPPEGSAKSIKLRVITKAGPASTVQFVDVTIIGPDGKYLPIVKTHPNPDFDIAVVNLTDVILREKIQAAWIPVDLFATPDRLKAENISVGDEIFLLGYPNAIFDPRNVSPILRIGIIATVPIEGYVFNDRLKSEFGLPERIDGFLVDANVFPGSSGSVVILKPQPTTIGPNGGTVVSAAKKIPYVLGIISASIPITDSALKSTQRMGLGVAYSADAIRTAIEQFYSK